MQPAMRWLWMLAAGGVIVACDGGGGTLRRADGTLFSSSGGEVALADGSNLRFSITSDRYKRWDAAQRALDHDIAARFGRLLQPSSPTEGSIDRATAYLQRTPQARQAIERAGMSVRDFVLMTVALEQEMRIASGRGAASETPVTPPPMSYPYPYPVDTAYPAPPPVLPETIVPVLPSPPVDTSIRIDTVFTRPPPRDTVITSPRRDSLTPPNPTRRDTTITPPPRPPPDTARDTTRRIPPDTLFRR